VHDLQNGKRYQDLAPERAKALLAELAASTKCSPPPAPGGAK